MKKATAIVTLLLHIVCAATVSVSAHVCGDQIADVAIWNNSSVGCGMEEQQCESESSSSESIEMDETCCSDTTMEFGTQASVQTATASSSLSSIDKSLEYKTLAVVILNIFADALLLHAEAHKPQPLSAADAPPPHTHSHDILFTKCMLI